MATRPRIFRDPVHANVDFSRLDDWDVLAMKLIETPEVQRLRRVRQPGLAALVYPGAEHSRFTHTLGVAHLAKRLYRASMLHAGRAPDADELATVMAAAVLHDTGHPPFSHAIEQELGIKHESVTVGILKGDSQVNAVLTERGGDSFVDAVSGHIDGSSDEPTVDLISSQLDADRLDYVLRDGYHAGVPNAHYDLERTVQMIQRDDDGICFDERAQFAIEGYFIARYHLYLQLYFHKTVRAAEAMLRALIRRARHVAESGGALGPMAPHLENLIRNRKAEDSVRVCDADLWCAFETWARGHYDRILKDLSARLLDRRLFKAVDVPTRETGRYFQTVEPRLREMAITEQLEPEYYVLFDEAKDTPYKVADLGAETSVRVIDGSGRPRILEALSGIIRDLQVQAYQKGRCCVPMELRSEAVRLLS